MDKPASPTSGVKTFNGPAAGLSSVVSTFKIAALKIGVIDKAILSTQEVEALAELPSREVLLSQLLGLLMSAPTKLVRLLNEPAASLARVIKARAGGSKSFSQ